MIGNRLRELREARSWSQVQLANRLGLSRQSICNWENDNVVPSIEALVRVSDYFSVSTDYLLERDDKEYIEVSGLTQEQVADIQRIIKYIRHAK